MQRTIKAENNSQTAVFYFGALCLSQSPYKTLPMSFLGSGGEYLEAQMLDALQSPHTYPNKNEGFNMQQKESSGMYYQNQDMQYEHVDGAEIMPDLSPFFSNSVIGKEQDDTLTPEITDVTNKLSDNLESRYPEDANELKNNSKKNGTKSVRKEDPSENESASARRVTRNRSSSSKRSSDKNTKQKLAEVERQSSSASKNSKSSKSSKASSEKGRRSDVQCFKRKGSTSKYKGVLFVKSQRKWRAQLCLKGGKQYIGSFHDELEAAKKRDERIRELFGEKTELLNFPNGAPESEPTKTETSKRKSSEVSKKKSSETTKRTPRTDTRKRNKVSPNRKSKVRKSDSGVQLSASLNEKGNGDKDNRSSGQSSNPIPTLTNVNMNNLRNTNMTSAYMQYQPNHQDQMLDGHSIQDENYLNQDYNWGQCFGQTEAQNETGIQNEYSAGQAWFEENPSYGMGLEKRISM